METLAPVVVGALLALTGSVLVQLLVVPRVDALRRRHERWEVTVAALGEQLAFTDDEVTDQLKDALFGVLKARDDYDLSSEDYEKIEAALEANEEHQWLKRLSSAWELVQEAYARHHKLLIQIGWLMTKLEANAPSGRNLNAAKAAHAQFCGSAVGLRQADSLDLRTMTPVSEAAYDGIALEMLEYFTRHAKARDAFLLEVKSLLVAGKSREADFTDPYRRALAKKGLDPDDPNLVSPEKR